jgi:hypothetical protein
MSQMPSRCFPSHRSGSLDEQVDQLGPGAAADLAVDAAQVELHVLGLKNKAAAISRLDLPSATSLATWNSWGVEPAGGRLAAATGGLPGGLELGPGLLGPRGGAQLLEGGQGGPEAVPSGCAVFGSAQLLAVAELGAGRLKRHGGATVPLVGLGEGFVDLGGAQNRPRQRAAAASAQVRPVAVTCCWKISRALSFYVPSGPCLACADDLDFDEAAEDLESEAL